MKIVSADLIIECDCGASNATCFTHYILTKTLDFTGDEVDVEHKSVLQTKI